MSLRLQEPRTLLGFGLVGLLVIACVIVMSAVYRERAGLLTVTFLDVGQGDSIYIETPNGTQVLIDGGQGRSVLRALGTQMSFFDRSIDVVVVSHPDGDHIGGLVEVFERYDIDTIVQSGVEHDSPEHNALVDAVVAEESTSIRARSGTTLALDVGVTLQFLFPDRDVSTVETNTASVIAKLTYGDTSFMFTGDAPQGIEQYLVQLYGTSLASDVLKLGHHGSRTSSSLSFLGFVDPTFAIVSAGCDNSYGHPHEDVLDRLRRLEVTTLSTCEMGSVMFTTDGVTLQQKQP